MEGIHGDVLKPQKQFEEDDKDEKSPIKKKVPGFVHYPSVLSSGIQIFLTGEALIRLYHVVCPHLPLYFDATGSLVRPIPRLRYRKNNPKRILLYSLVITHPAGEVPPIALFDYITSEHHIFSIRQPFLSLKEMEQKIYGSGNGVNPNTSMI